MRNEVNISGSLIQKSGDYIVSEDHLETFLMISIAIFIFIILFYLIIGL